MCGTRAVVMCAQGASTDTARVAGAGIVCELGPRLRFGGAPGEQWTMFFRDPSGNALEFKAMSKPENLFARYKV